MSPKLYDSEKWLRYQFTTLRKTPQQIAVLAKCSPMTIYRKLEKLGLI